MSLPRLIALPYSPWSIAAKWALEHHAVPHRYTSYLPMLGEPLLRYWTGRWRGGASVPVFVTDAGPVQGSDAIARWADAGGDGAPLFPEGAAVEPWVDRSNRLLDAARALVIEASLRSPAALVESVPGPRALGPALVPVGKLGARFLARKYRASNDAEACERIVREELEALRGALRDRETLVGDTFTFADLTMACAVGGVAPPGEAIDHLGPASRRCWTRAELADEFQDVVAWRDRVLEAHWPATRRPTARGHADGPRPTRDHSARSSQQVATRGKAR